MKKLFLACAALMLVTIGCLTVGSGSSDHGNARIAGVVENELGFPADDVIITLLPDDFNPLEDYETNCERVTATNWSGCFSLDSIKEGTYTLTGKDLSNNRFIEKSIVVKNSQTLTFSFRTKMPGNMTLSSDSMGLSEDDAVFIPGTGIWAVSRPGSMNISELPPGILTLRGYNLAKKQEIGLGNRFERFELLSAKRLNMLYQSDTPRYIDSTGEFQTELIGFTGAQYSITATFPLRNPQNEYVYRFSWGDGSISNWFYNPVQSHSWREPGIYMVQVQEERTGVYLAWSEPIMVRITERD